MKFESLRLRKITMERPESSIFPYGSSSFSNGINPFFAIQIKLILAKHNF